MTNLKFFIFLSILEWKSVASISQNVMVQNQAHCCQTCKKSEHPSLGYDMQSNCPMCSHTLSSSRLLSISWLKPLTSSAHLEWRCRESILSFGTVLIFVKKEKKEKKSCNIMYSSLWSQDRMVHGVDIRHKKIHIQTPSACPRVIPTWSICYFRSCSRYG